MKREEKIEMISSFVVDQFENGSDKDTICEAVFGEFPGKIKFSELPGLVYTIGRESGFIKTVKEARSDAEGLMDEVNWANIKTVRDRDDLADEIAGTTEAKSGWVRLRMKERCKDLGIQLSGTRSIGGWRAVMVNEVRNNPKVTQGRMIELISPYTKNPKDNVVYFMDIIKAAYNFGLEDGKTD